MSLPLGFPQMCNGNQIETRSEKIKNILNTKEKVAKVYRQFSTTADETNRSSANPEKTENGLFQNDQDSPLKNKTDGDEGDIYQEPVVNMCCECSVPPGLSGCVPSDSELLETESVCFFKNLPPLTFDPYTLCQYCGRRFDNTDFEKHVCCKVSGFPCTPCEKGPICETKKEPKYQPPFIMKDIRPSCVDICDCVRDGCGCGGLL